MFTVVRFVGNISSGKSTLMEKALSSSPNKANYVPMREPVIGNRILEAYGENPKEYAFCTQAYFEDKYWRDLLELSKNLAPGQVILSDYNLCSVFHRSLYKQGLLSLDQICMLQSIGTQYRELLDVRELFLYVTTPPEICLLRMNNRGRQCEKGHSLDYLVSLDECYKEVMASEEEGRVTFIDNACPLQV